MNPFSATSWLWRALRFNSITFATLFACGVLGLSIVRVLRNALGALGVPWLALLILPALLIGAVAKRESKWVPAEPDRRKWARRLVFGSVAVSILLALVFPKKTPPADPNAPRQDPVRLHGPSGK